MTIRAFVDNLTAFTVHRWCKRVGETRFQIWWLPNDSRELEAGIKKGWDHYNPFERQETGFLPHPYMCNSRAVLQMMRKDPTAWVLPVRWLQRFLEVVFLLCLVTGEVIRKRVTFRVPYLPSVARRARDGGRSDSQAQGHCSHCVPIYVSACNVRKYSKLCALVRYSYIYKGSPKTSGIIPIIEMLNILLKSPKQSVPD